MSGKLIVIKTGAFSPVEKAAMKKLKKLDKKSLQALLDKKNVRVVRESRKGNPYLSHSEATAANLKTFETLYSKNPDLVRVVKATPESGFVTVNYPGGRTLNIPLKDKSSLIHSLIMGSNIARADQHPKFVMDHIKSVVSESVSRKPALSSKFAKLAALKPPTKITRSFAVKATTDLLSFWLKHGKELIDLVPYKAVACGDEIGVGRNRNNANETTGDMTEAGGNSRKTTFNPNGLFQNLDFPLKPHLTCIRNQAARGSCEAFGLIAAVEAAVSVKYGQKVNLSEQALYKNYKLDWFPEPFFYSDGAVAILNLLAQVLNSYVFSYESDWDYNPSYMRVPHDFPPNVPPYYTHSDDGYVGLACSDTNHQAEQVCRTIENKVLKEVVTKVSEWIEDAAGVIDSIVSFVTGQSNGHWVEKTVTTWEEVIETSILCEYETDPPASARYKITDFAPYYFPLMDWDTALTTTKVFLDHRVPVIWEFQVLPSFANDAGGFVSGSEDLKKITSTLGGHCALIVGYANNAKLPSGAPPAEGGGYFIVKNSWGTYKGDCGYYYVSYEYMNTWTTCMTALKAITHV